MPGEGCPKCGKPLTPDTTVTHCPGDAHASCWWGRHTCGAIVDMRRTTHWISYPITGAPHAQQD